MWPCSMGKLLHLNPKFLLFPIFLYLQQAQLAIFCPALMHLWLHFLSVHVPIQVHELKVFVCISPRKMMLAFILIVNNACWLFKSQPNRFHSYFITLINVLDICWSKFASALCSANRCNNNSHILSLSSFVLLFQLVKMRVQLFILATMHLSSS